MKMIPYILMGYLVGAALMAVRLGWHMAFRLDRFDWHNSRGDIWLQFLLFSLLWPLMLLRPQILVDPAKVFDHYGFAARMREEARLRDSPPPCGALVCYRQGHGGFEETFGEFTFRSADLEEAFADQLHKNPSLATYHEGAILKWLRLRDDSIIEPTMVPSAWKSFQFMADTLLRSGHGEIRCLKCDKLIPHSELVLQDDGLKPGWTYGRLVCPDGHYLLIVEVAHINMQPRRDAD
jgi:hypothetical protein